MTGNKKLLIIELKLEDYLVLCVLAIGVVSTFFANKGMLNVALAALFAATLMYFIASTYARRAGGGNSRGFTRALNSFVSGMLFLVAPCIFFYHWGYNGPFNSVFLLIFMICGIFRISAFNYFGSRKDAHKYYYVGLPVFWSPAVVLLFYVMERFTGTGAAYPLLSVVLAVFSVLMLVNVEFKYLHKPKSWNGR
jgi:phosphatidylserine synthase